MKLDNIFTSRMVIAANKPIKIYGTGEGTAVVNFLGNSKKGDFTGGKWMLELPAADYGGPYILEIVLNGQKTVLEDVYVGDVYIFAVQSNMQFKMREGQVDFSGFDSNDMLRLYSPDRVEKTEYYTTQDGWVTCDKAHIGDWSALAYLCGADLCKNAKSAVGIIVAYQGASVIESWLPKGKLAVMGVCLTKEQQSETHHIEPFSTWNMDGFLYDAMITQIKPYNVSAFVWYQGESDTSFDEAAVYDKELTAFIGVMREDFCDNNLPFVVVQITDFDFCRSGWPFLQEAQSRVAQTVPNVKLVISRDVCVSNDIHPGDKSILAKRIVAALSK